MNPTKINGFSTTFHQKTIVFVDRPHDLGHSLSPLAAAGAGGALGPGGARASEHQLGEGGGGRGGKCRAADHVEARQRRGLRHGGLRVERRLPGGGGGAGGVSNLLLGAGEGLRDMIGH